MKRIAIILLSIGAVVALALFGFARLNPAGFADAKRETRLALGLPKLWVRDFNTDTRGYQPLACPGPEALVIVTGGQSNAANALSEPLPVDPAAQAYMLARGRCYRLRDPVLGATNRGGSLWTAMGSALWRATGRPVVFINGAVGGSQLGDWLDDRSGYRQRLLAEVALARAAGLKPAWVFWVQGETDAAVSVDPARFVADLQRLIGRFDASGLLPPGAPWLVYRSTHCMHRPGNGPAIDAAVTAFAASDKRVLPGPEASDLGDAMRRDGCHFNGAGRAVLTAEAIADLKPLLAPPRVR